MFLFLPRYLWRFLWWWVPIALLLSAAMLLTAGSWAPGQAPQRLTGLMFRALLFFHFFLASAWTIRLYLRLRRTGWRLCAGCGHDLRGVPEPGECPRCGWETSVERLRRAWKLFRGWWILLPRYGERDGQLRCPACRYDLRGVAGPDATGRVRCPECAGDFNLEALRTAQKPIFYREARIWPPGAAALGEIFRPPK